MSRYKVYWQEYDGHGGVEGNWVVAESSGYVDTYSSMKAIAMVKRALGATHIKRFKCKNFRTVKK